MLNFVENLLQNERGPMNDQDLTKTDYDPDHSLVLIESLSHFLTSFIDNSDAGAFSHSILIPVYTNDYMYNMYLQSFN
jgi:hypothetical protein